MHYPRRLRWFSLHAGRCVCGLLWPCPDAGLERARERYAAVDRNGAWTVQTAVYPQVGRAGNLTPAQRHRARGGEP